ncbi:hypothetical protein Tco_1150712, partial [Tanacetum coccineum]
AMESCAVGHFGAMAWHQANSQRFPPLLRRWWVGLVVEAVLGSDGGGRLGSGDDD